RRGQLAAEVEQLVLDLPENLVEPAVVLALGETLLVERADDAHDRVQLVDRPVGDDARRVLGHALAADQRGLATVAQTRVDARDADRHRWPPLRYSTRREDPGARGSGDGRRHALR